MDSYQSSATDGITIVSKIEPTCDYYWPEAETLAVAEAEPDKAIDNLLLEIKCPYQIKSYDELYINYKLKKHIMQIMDNICEECGQHVNDCHGHFGQVTKNKTVLVTDVRFENELDTIQKFDY